MKKIKIYLYASICFLKTLLTRKDPVQGKCKRGHAIFSEWKSCPKCKIIEAELKTIESYEKKETTMGMLCVSGTQTGEFFQFKQGASLIGANAESNVCITPNVSKTPQNVCLISNEQNKLTAARGSFFELEGKETTQSNLLDYDRLKLYGNSFLFFSLKSKQGEQNV